VVVITAAHLDFPKERLHRAPARGIAFLQRAGRGLVGEERRVGKKLREQSAGVAVQRRAQPFLQPRRVGAQRLLAGQALPR
jgi:hypothetical protein